MSPRLPNEGIEIPVGANRRNPTLIEVVGQNVFRAHALAPRLCSSEIELLDTCEDGFYENGPRDRRRRAERGSTIEEIHMQIVEKGADFFPSLEHFARVDEGELGAVSQQLAAA